MRCLNELTIGHDDDRIILVVLEAAQEGAHQRLKLCVWAERIDQDAKELETEYDRVASAISCACPAQASRGRKSLLVDIVGELLDELTINLIPNLLARYSKLDQPPDFLKYDRLVRLRL